MLFVDISRHLLELSDMPASPEREGIIEHIKQEIRIFEEVLYGIRDEIKICFKTTS